MLDSSIINDPEFKKAAKAFWTRFRFRRNKDWFLAYKAERGCSKCGFNNPWALHFHHLEDKTAKVSDLINSNGSIARVMEEIKKCVILCANCHAVEHQEQYEKQLLAEAQVLWGEDDD